METTLNRVSKQLCYFVFVVWVLLSNTPAQAVSQPECTTDSLDASNIILSAPYVAVKIN